MQPVSVHGGHTGEFCCHGRDTLEQVILKYIDLGFQWVGITEHIFPPADSLRYPDEVAAGLDSRSLEDRFRRYMRTCRELQHKYRDEIDIFAAFESETYTGYQDFIPWAIEEFKPDYIVGSVHHVDDICIDYSRDGYLGAVRAAGGLEALYCRYFDIQHHMIESLSPAVVGHFDLIRIFDPHYHETIRIPEIWDRIIRNLKLIRTRDIIMDFNLRALMKGAGEPYISLPILQEAASMKIKVVPGDDSHGTGDIGVNMARAMEILARVGITPPWPRPGTPNHFWKKPK
ncbi:MAG: histidinol-phosphatase [Desulfamplus sp.]|nr:histidinol-phosphatase [Desulfamplus sp.]